MSEVASKGNRGFYSSFQYVTLIGGQLLALLVLAILQAIFTTEELKAWAWRVPFLIGAIAALVAMYLRRSLAETASEDAMHRREAGSVVEVVRRHPRAVLIVLAFTMGGSLYFYTFTTYMQKYLVNTAHMDATVVTFVMTAVLILYMLIQPAFGALSDVIGRKNSMILFTALGALGAPPLLFALGGVASPYAAFMLVLLALVISSFYTSISGVVKAELFPTEVRALGVGLSYAVANALFGGTAEYVALWLKTAGHEPWFAWYVAGMVAIGLAASVIMPDTRKYGYLEGSGQIER
jgi:MHS family alpha-ketoglutarate permease-like MFS transporter